MSFFSEIQIISIFCRVFVGTGFYVFVSLQQLMLMAVLNCLFDSLSQMLRYVCTAAIFLQCANYNLSFFGKD